MHETPGERHPLWHRRRFRLIVEGAPDEPRQRDAEYGDANGFVHTTSKIHRVRINGRLGASDTRRLPRATASASESSVQRHRIGKAMRRRVRDKFLGIQISPKQNQARVGYCLAGVGRANTSRWNSLILSLMLPRQFRNLRNRIRRMAMEPITPHLDYDSVCSGVWKLSVLS